MSKNKKNKASKSATVAATVATAVVADFSAEVVTKDGETVSAEKALTVSYDVLMAAKHAAPKDSPIQQFIFKMIGSLRVGGPDAICFASTDTPKAKQVGAILATLRVNTDKPLFIPLGEARQAFAAHRATQEGKKTDQVGTVAKTAEEIFAGIRKQAEEKAARAKARREEQDKLVASAEGLIDPSLVAEASAEEVARNEQRAQRVTRLEGFITRGMDTIPSILVLNEEERPYQLRGVVDGKPLDVEILSFYSLKEKMEELRVKPEEIPVVCQFCDKKGKLGDREEACKPTCKGGQHKCFIFRKLGIPTTHHDGSGRPWIHTKDSSNGRIQRGDLRPQDVLACSVCSKVGMGLSNPKPNDRDSQPSVWVNDVFSKFVEWLARGEMVSTWSGKTDGKDIVMKTMDGQEVKTEKPVMVRGQRQTLTAPPRFNPEDMAAAQAAVAAASRAKSPEDAALDDMGAGTSETE